MYRLAYLFPRLILLGLAFLAASIAGDTIAQRLVTAHLESSIGMDVEIGRLRTRTANGKVFVNDFALVDPARPLTNLFQADLAFFEVDMSAISRRQLVIKNARASQVRLGVPRTSAVRGPIANEQSSLEVINDVTEFRPSQVGRFLANNDSIRLAWLDQFKNNNTPAAIAETKKPKTNQLYELASATNQKWNKGFQQQNGQLKLVSSSFAKVVKGHPSPEEIARNGLSGPPNPLRARVDHQPQKSELDEIIQTLERLQRQQNLLERQAVADMASLEAAYQTETASQKKAEPIEPAVSPETLSQLLLAELHRDIANEAMDWFAGVRTSVSACSLSDRSVEETETDSGRGELVEIPGAARKLPTVIKKLTFDGAGRFNQQHVNFAGEVFDITDQPATADLPATFKLRAQGDQHFVLQGSIDRRSGSCSDSVSIDFPSMPLGPQNLGTKSEMLVTTGPRTTAHGAIVLKVDGRKLSGTMRLDFSDVALVVEHLHDVAGGKEVALRLNQALSTLQQFESTAVFKGTLDHPQLEFESSFGEELAAAMTEINKGRKNKTQVASKDEVDQFYSTQILPLKTNIEMELDSITRSIESQIGLAQKMRASLRAAKSRWPEVR